MSLSRRSLLRATAGLAAAAAPLRWAFGQPAGLTIAAASDLRFALEELAARFRRQQPGLRVDLVFGASGKLTEQVRQGAPFDLFLSADIAFAQALHEEGHTATAPRRYATGRLALWSLDEALGRLGLDDVVKHPAVQRFAIANPRTAPYGQRAVDALRHRGLYEAVAPRFVLGENVAQALQFIDTGAAQAGLVAHSLLLAPALAGKGHSSLIPAAWHSPLDQAFVVTRRAADHAGAAAFARFLESAEARQQLARFGFV